MREYLINGIPLRDPQGKYMIDYTASTLFGDNSRAITSGGAFGFHGEQAERENYFGTSRETLVINVLGDTKDEHNVLLRGLQGLFARKESLLVTAPQRTALVTPGSTARVGRTFDISNDFQRYSLCRAVGSPALERVNERTARMTIILENLWGFYYSVSDFTVNPMAITTFSQAFSLGTLPGDSNAPLNSGLLRIKGPLTSGGSVIVRDSVSGKSVGYKPTTALLGSEYVLIDVNTLKASKVTSDTWDVSVAEVVTNRVVLGGEGAFALEPGAPAGTWPDGGFEYGATVTSVGYTSGQTSLGFRFKRSYLS